MRAVLANHGLDDVMRGVVDDVMGVVDDVIGVMTCCKSDPVSPWGVAL